MNQCRIVYNTDSVCVVCVYVCVVWQRYDPKMNQWSDMAPLPIQRSGFGSAVVDFTLYLVGGCNNLSRVDTVDRYDPDQNEWSSTSPMSVRRSGLAVGVAPAFLF